MGVLPAQHIRAINPPVIDPFHEREVHRGMTFGLGPAGYDVRIAQDVHLRAGGAAFSLASTIERFALPSDLIAYVKDKSTWARRGLCVQNTVIEPGWRGFLTLELTYHGDSEILVRKGDPIAQIVFHRLEAATDRPYVGKYQDQPAGPQKAIEEAHANKPRSVRHSWADPVRDEHRTYRECRKCSIFRVTHHEGDGFPWTTFERDGSVVSTNAAPPCDGGAGV